MGQFLLFASYRPVAFGYFQHAFFLKRTLLTALYSNYHHLQSLGNLQIALNVGIMFKPKSSIQSYNTLQELYINYINYVLR